MKKFTRSVLPILLAFGLVVGVKSVWASSGSLDPAFGYTSPNTSITVRPSCS